jgi:hypothetical protein
LTVVVQLAAEPESAQAAVAAVAALGVHLTPMHPGVRDTGLAAWYVATSDSDDDEETTAAALRGLTGVSAAYVRPDAEPA